MKTLTDRFRSAVLLGAAGLLLGFGLSACTASDNATAGNAAKDLGNAARDVGRAASDFSTSEPAKAVKDALLVATVKARLVAVDIDSARYVQVKIHDGIAELNGKAPSEAKRTAFEKAASGTPGVSSLVDGLTVDPKLPSGGQVATDLALTTEVVAGLVAQTGINALAMRVETRDSVVTLSGTVPSSVIPTALGTAAKISGVKAVVNKLTPK